MSSTQHGAALEGTAVLVLNIRPLLLWLVTVIGWRMGACVNLKGPTCASCVQSRGLCITELEVQMAPGGDLIGRA